jgi:hypothetical protein
MKDTAPQIATLLSIEMTAFTCELNESFSIVDSTERQTDSCDKSTGSHESVKDSTALRRGSDVGRKNVDHVRV